MHSYPKSRLLLERFSFAFHVKTQFVSRRFAPYVLTMFQIIECPLSFSLRTLCSLFLPPLPLVPRFMLLITVVCVWFAGFPPPFHMRTSTLSCPPCFLLFPLDMLHLCILWIHFPHPFQATKCSLDRKHFPHTMSRPTIGPLVPGNLILSKQYMCRRVPSLLTWQPPPKKFYSLLFFSVFFF